MKTQLLYQPGNGSRPHLIGHFKESPKEVLSKLYLNHDIYRYNNILSPVDNNIEQRCSGLIIQESNVPSQESIDNLWLSNALTSPIDEEGFYNAIQDAIEHYLTIFEGSNLNYLELRGWKQDQHREDSIKDILDIISVTLNINNPTAQDLELIADLR